MNLIALKYFVAVAENGNISRVARELFVSQPAVSKMIRQLEAEIGCPLFEHRRGRVELNDDGKRFYVHARRIVEEMNEGELELQTYGGTERTQIRVGCTIYDFLSEVSPEYLVQHPKVTLSQFFGDAGTLREQVLANQLHFAVSTEPLAENLPWEVMLECPMVMLIPAGHPACRRTSVSLADFRNDPFVINTMGLDEEKTLRLCAEAGFEPTIVLRTNEAYTAGNLLNRMQAVSICSADSICSRLPMYGLIDSEGPAGGMGMHERNTVLLEGLDHTHRIGLTRRGKRMNEACEEFYRTVQRYLEAKNRQVQRFVTHYYHD